MSRSTRAEASSVKPRLLDLFCGAGGAAMGYHRAGFDVVGVDIKPQPHYPFEFYCEDAMSLLEAASVGSTRWTMPGGTCLDLGSFDAVHASPPCQAYSATRTIWNNRGDHPELVELTRELLKRTGLPWVMENVPGAPLSEPVVLCGSMFGLQAEEWELRRHRLFELDGFSCMVPPCAHNRPVLGVYGGHARDRRRKVMGVYGHGGGDPNRNPNRGHSAPIALARQIMGIAWMTAAEISQAIPPAYTEHIGGFLMTEVLARDERRRAA